MDHQPQANTGFMIGNHPGAF
jgi:ParB-like chromosome segregation protein Spo0J